MEIKSVEKKRYDWIDALRAIAIIIVMLWHMSNGLETQWVYSIFTAPIMIPLFFSITGFVFNDCKGNAKLFYKKLLIQIIIPWLGLALGKAFLIAVLRESFGYFVEYSIGVLTGANLWYMPCCVISEIIHFYIRKYASKETYVYIFAVMAMIVGYILAKGDVMNIFCINIALIVQGFYLLGYMAKTKHSFYECSNRRIIVGILTYFGLCIVSLIFYNHCSMDVHKNDYYNVILCATMIFIGCELCYLVAPRLKKYPKILTFIGKNTLIFYIFHYDTIKPFEKICIKIGFQCIGWGGVLMEFMWAVIVCSLIAYFLNRFAPVLIGKKKSIL